MAKPKNQPTEVQPSDVITSDSLKEFHQALMFMRKMSMRTHTIVSAMEASERGKLVELIWSLTDENARLVDDAEQRSADDYVDRELA